MSSQPPQDILRDALRRGSAVFTRQPRQNTKVMTNAMLRRSQPTRKNQPTGFVRPQAGNVQHFQRSYERYLDLAQAEALAGDRIMAENYFQHAEHYFRAMRENHN